MSSVLLLDFTWLPSRRVSVRKGAILLLKGKAIPVVEEIAGVLHSPSTTLEVPEVIQVTTVFKNSHVWSRGPFCTNSRVLDRDERVCQFVIGGRPCTNKAETVDHLLPQSRGGQDTWENLVASCFTHNNMKDNWTLEEMSRAYDWSLKRDPKPPKFVERMLRGSGPIPESWKQFMPD